MEGYKRVFTLMAILLAVSSFTMFSNSGSDNGLVSPNAQRDIPITVL